MLRGSPVRCRRSSPRPRRSGAATRRRKSAAPGAAVRADGAIGGRELIVATGADRVRFLHGLVTGDVAGTPAGGGARAALRTAKGHVVAEMRIFVRPDDIW